MKKLEFDQIKPIKYVQAGHGGLYISLIYFLDANENKLAEFIASHDGIQTKHALAEGEEIVGVYGYKDYVYKVLYSLGFNVKTPKKN